MRLTLDQLPPATDSDRSMLASLNNPSGKIGLDQLPPSEISLEQDQQYANEEFQYAQKENIPLEDSRIILNNKRKDEEWYKLNADIKVFLAQTKAEDLQNHLNLLKQSGQYKQYHITAKERLLEAERSIERGVSQLKKVPGIGLKIVGEQMATKEERKKFFGVQELKPIDKAAVKLRNMLINAGNNCIAYFNDEIENKIPRSNEIEWAKSQKFTEYPVLQTISAVGESTPSYAAAVAATILTKNPQIGAAMIATTSGTQSYESLRSEGVDPDLALLGASIVGTIEVVTEKVPMDAILKGGSKKLLRRTLETGTKEAFQEMLTQMGQNYAQAVVKDIDPSDPNYQNLLQAAQQEWSVISEGLAPSGAAGFVMGFGASPFSPRPDLGRNASQLQSEYQLDPNVDQAFQDAVLQIRNQVNSVSRETKAAPAKTPQESTAKAEKEEAAAPPPPTGLPTEIEGQGEKRIRGLSQSVEERAIEAELVETLGQLPEYQVLNMRQQAQQALQIVNNEPDRVFRVLEGKEPVPSGLYLGSLFVAAETIARNAGDVDTLIKLKDSRTVVAATEYGRNVKAFDPGLQENTPARDMHKIEEARKQRAERKKQAAPTTEEISILQKRVDELETKLAEKLTKTEKPTRRTKKYGESNKLVKKEEYDAILKRIGKQPLQMSVGIPTPQNFSDLAKISLYHMEAIGRNFADWSAQVVRDLGDWVKPYLKIEYDTALAELERQGIDVVDKKLESYKKRLRTMTQKKEVLFEGGEFKKTPRTKIVLDEEAKKLKRQYEIARDKLKAVQDISGEVTYREAQKIAQLSKIAADKKEKMLNSKRRTSAADPTKSEMEWGIAQVMYSDYVNALKQRAEKLTFTETMMQYLKDPLKFLSDIGGTLRSVIASWDNSFIGRQGLLVFYKGLTFDKQSAKIWIDTFNGSWMTIWNSLTGKSEQVRIALKAMQISDPEYEMIRKTKTDIGTIEEEFPNDIPTKIPLLGRIFEASEDAYVWSAHYMRYRLIKMELEIYRNSGGDMTNTRELESMGTVVNGLTGRGKIGRYNSSPGFVNNIFFSPRYLKSSIDFLTAHVFDPNVSLRMKKRAAMNLVRFIAGASSILLLADWFDDDAVTWDTNSADFGKIRIGNSRFSVGGSIPALIVLCSRIITGETTSSITGKKKKLNTGEYFGKTKLDLVYDFFENKFSPGAQYVANRLRGGDKFKSDFEKKYGPLYKLTPLSIQNILEAAPMEDRANLIMLMTLEGIGVNTQTYEMQSYKKKKGAFD